MYSFGKINTALAFKDILRMIEHFYVLYIYSTWSLVSKNRAIYRIWSTYECVIAQKRKEGSNSMLWSQGVQDVQGVPKKMHHSSFLL